MVRWLWRFTALLYPSPGTVSMPGAVLSPLFKRHSTQLTSKSWDTDWDLVGRRLNSSRSMVMDGGPMFAAAYMGRKRCFSNAFTPRTRALARIRGVEELEGAAPRLFRPTYAKANMGHPSREAASLFPLG